MDATGTPLLLSRRFAPLFWCQFFAAFNDNFLKTALVFLILFRGHSVWLHSINNTEDVNLIYSYVEQMLLADRYIAPPAALAGRHFERYIQSAHAQEA